VCEGERDRESGCVCERECVYVCVRDRERVCGVCERDRERERVCEGERESVFMSNS
jgi:hypothetical protein